MKNMKNPSSSHGWAFLGILFLLLGLAGLLASLYPSYKASNMDVLDAIATGASAVSTREMGDAVARYLHGDK